MRRKIKLTDEDYRKAEEFALATYKHHVRDRRSDDQIINNIIQGKLGEIAFYNTDPDSYTNPDFNQTTHADPGWDIENILSGHRIDVKTIKEGSKYVSFNMQRLNADSYAVMVLQDDGHCYLLDEFSKSYMRNNGRPSKFNSSYYIIV
jgi:hypothetical protein